jgi:putative ABC transport system permease protein
MSPITIGPALAVVLVVLTGLTVLISRWYGQGSGAAPVIAVLRAVVQLAAVAAIIAVVLRSWWLTAAFLTVMLVVAAGTSGHRITGRLRGASWWTLPAICLSVLPVVSLILVSGAVPLQEVSVLPVAGILIGGAMTATSLAGRRIADELDARWNSYEELLALGVPRRPAVRHLGRPVAVQALVPTLDQTRTVGLVTLPGAFVGVLLAGASPWQAAAAQLLVLVGLLLIQSIAVAVTGELIATGRLPAGSRRLVR